MKRMNKDERKFWCDSHYGKLSHDLLCRFGEWNQKKLLNEFEKKLKFERMRK